MTDKINELIQAELERANTIHPPFFNSAHEGYAVILEEVDEVNNEMEDINDLLQALWSYVKMDLQPNIDYKICQIRVGVVQAITELIQVAAMCDKYKQSSEKW